MTTVRPGRALNLLFAPTPPPARASGIGLAVLRVIAGLLWLAQVWWKVPPDFGESRRTGLWFWTHLAVDHPVFPPYSWLVEHLVLPNFTPFGWLVLVVETLLSVLLLTGTAVRRAARATGNAAPAARRLLGGWGAILALLAVVAGVKSLDDELVAPRGEGVGYPPLQLFLGDYNMLAALALLVVAVLMLAAAVMRTGALAMTAAIVAAVAALSIYVQLGRAEVWLGGNPSTAAVFVCAAVIAIGARPVRAASTSASASAA